MKRFGILFGATVLTAAAHAQVPPATPVPTPASACPAEQAALNRVSSEFKPQLDSISAKGNDLKKDSERKSDLSLEFSVEMKEQKWVFDLPSVTMKDQRIVLGLPDVKMNLREFSFDIPETIMVAKKVGQYPETVVDGFNITVRWKDIITHVPEVRMSRRSFKTDIPEVRMRDSDIIFGLPEVRMERQEWILKVPEFTLKKIEIGGVPVYSDFDKRGKELEKSANAVKGEMKSSLVSKANALYNCLRTAITSQRAMAVTQMQSALSQIDDSVKSLSAYNISPSTVKIIVDGKEKTLADQQLDLKASMMALDKKFNDVLQQLDADEKASIGRIAAG